MATGREPAKDIKKANNTTEKAAAGNKRRVQSRSQKSTKASSKKNPEAAEEEKKRFQRKLIALKELAKSKRNVLELAEINNFLADVELDEEKTEKVIEFLEASGVDVLRIPDDKDTDDDMILELEASGEVPDEEEIEKEKGVVIEEINMSQDNPEDVLDEIHSEAIFGDNYLAYPILGTPDKIKSFTRKKIKDYSCT